MMKLSTRLDRIKERFEEAIEIMDRFNASEYSMERNMARSIKNELEIVGLRIKHFKNLIDEEKRTDNEYM
jgi:hypothetical protein|tara:strand:- start:799 stop:1008 length:210 start_codon:yes stop_codon:yes gene_type:complete